MSLGNRLREARKRAGYTQRQLAEKIGAKHNSVSNWENDLNMPDPATIEAICASLGVTPNDLLISGELGTILISRDGFSHEEVDFIKKYRKVNEGAKGAVNALLEYYCKIDPTNMFNFSEKTKTFTAVEINDKQYAQNFEVINGKISMQSVAAGSGAYLDDDSFESISVQENALTKRASFYVPVSGNSMEPRFHNGDVLIIENVPVKYGEIGIFTLDGCGYVKVRGNSELISLNPDYAPIQMNDDIVCNGKVIGVLDPVWIID